MKEAVTLHTFSERLFVCLFVHLCLFVHVWSVIEIGESCSLHVQTGRVCSLHAVCNRQNGGIHTTLLWPDVCVSSGVNTMHQQQQQQEKRCVSCEHLLCVIL